MQEHVELEVSLEIIMAEIANCMFNLKTKEDEIKLNKLITLQESAYKGNRESVKQIFCLLYTSDAADD